MTTFEGCTLTALSHLDGYRCYKTTFPVGFEHSLSIVVNQDESAKCQVS